MYFLYGDRFSHPHDNVISRSIQLHRWNYMDFSSTLKVSTTIEDLKKMLEERHALSMDSFKLYHDTYSAENELPMDNKTISLKECGIKGGPQDNPPSSTIIYDFKPSKEGNGRDAVLLSFQVNNA